MSLKGALKEQSSHLNKKIALPESDDIRVLKAAKILASEGICQPVLIGNPAKIRENASKNNISLPENVEIARIDDDPKTEDYADYLYEKRKHRGMTQETARKSLQNPLWFAGAMLRDGRVDGCLAGATNATGEVIKAALFQVGTKPGGLVSSCFLMVMPDGRTFTYADCGVVPYPDSDQLAVIAADSAVTHQKLAGVEPVVALLSFSTKGSAVHERVDLVTRALAQLRKNHPEIQADGELQFDAAIIPEIASRKAPGSDVAGKANVFIFPNLDAGNIAYKITERLGGATALGPILQGLAKPVNDLSRGCSVEDIVLMSAVTSLLDQ